jgi:trigger factor
MSEVQANTQTNSQSNAVAVLALEGLIRKVHIPVDAQHLEKEIDLRIKDLSTRIKHPGFRPGKVPLDVVKRLHSESVKDQALEEVLKNNFWKVAFEQKLKIAGNITLDTSTPIIENQQTTYAVTFETFPDVVLPEMTDAALEKLITEVGDEDIKTTLDNMMLSRATYDQADKKATKNDRVTIDFVGRLDEVAFEGGTATDYAFVLGHGMLLPEFEAALEGMSAGESKKFPLTFPQNYGAKNLAGKAVEFEVSLKKVEAPVLPVLDDEFAKQFEVADVAALTARVKENMLREAKNRLHMKNREAVFVWLEKNAQMEVPQSLVDSETKRLREDFMKQMSGGKKVDTKKFGHLPDDLFKPRAVERVRLGLVLRHLEEVNQIAPNEAQIDQELQSRASVYDQPEEFLTWAKKDKDQINDVRAFVTEQLVVDWVFTHAKVAERHIPFKELLTQTQGA